MALLEYATMTVPDVVAKSVLSFYNKDPLFKRMRDRNKIQRSGGERVRIIRVKSGHSDVVQIDESNMSVPLNKKETLSQLEGDWARYIKPLIIPHFDQNRMTSKEEKKRYIDTMVKAAMTSLKNDFQRRLYVGNITKLRGLGTFNGNITDGTSLGFERGALQFVVPGSQTTAYLGESRNQDTTNEVDHWYNQYAEHTGIGTDFLPTAETIKITADTFAEDDEEGISMGLLGIADHVALSDEVRSYPGGGASALQYSVSDIESGKAHPTVYIANGVQYYSNRWINPTVASSNMAGVASLEHAFFFNPNTVEWWVNAGADFQVTPFKDHLETSNQDADVAYIICEVQAAVTNLMANGCTSNPT